MKRIIPALRLPVARTFRMGSFVLLLFAFSSTLYAQVVTVGVGGNYPTLKAAFDAINASTLTAPITIKVISNIVETAPAVLNHGSTSTNSIRIVPDGGGFSISGAMPAGSPLIDLNGADFVTIDGLKDGVNSLTIMNTTVSAIAGTSTIRFINGATNNLITNCDVLGSSTSSTSVAGGNIFFSTDANTANGNDNNLVSYCQIGPAGANLPTKGIYMSGSTANTTIANSGNTFTYNNIFDYFGAAVGSAGVYVGSGNTDNTISYNKFYQTATRTQPVNTAHAAIYINNTAGNNFLIRANKIGYANQAGTGTYSLVLASGGAASFVPIRLFIGNTTISKVRLNTIANISISGSASLAAFRGILIETGLTTVDSNFIGSQTSAGNITYTSTSSSNSDIMGIYSSSSSNWITNDNTIGGITASGSGTTAVYGIWANLGSSYTWQATNNIIGGNITTSMQSTTTAIGSKVVGMQCTLGGATLLNNTIRNLSAAGGTGTNTSASVMGICIITTSSNHTISQNLISSLSNSNSSAATVVTGIQFTGSTGGSLVSKNLIHSLNCASPTGTINGINITGGTTTYQNNIITLGAGIATGCAINGINEPVSSTSLDKVYFNSIYVGGTGVSGSASTFAFNSLVTSNVRNIRNNIFYNARSNGAGTGKHYAVQVGGTTANPTGLTIDYNDYFVNGTGNVFGRFNGLDRPNIAAWKSSVGQDGNSQNGDPQFISTTGSSASVLHINASIPTPVESAGITISGIADDYDAELRASTPDIGADEINGIALSQPVINYVSKNPNATQCVATDRTITANITAGSYNLTSVTLKYSYNNGTISSIPMSGGSTTAGSTSDWTGTIPATPANPTVSWNVTVTDGGGYTKTFTGISYADEPIPELYITAAPNPVCPGDSTTLTVGIVPPLAPAASSYCASTHSSCTSSDIISKIVLNTLNNNTATTCPGTYRYTYFSGGGSQTTTLVAVTGTYNLAITFGSDSRQYAGAWIDYNHDGVYAASEFISAPYASTDAGSNGTLVISFIVPAWAYNGLTHMRIIGGNDLPLTASNACGLSNAFGETQDYDITITGGTDMAPLPASIVSVIWLGNAGAVVGSANPLIRYPTATSEYTAIVTDSNGCTKNVSITVEVLQATTSTITDTACNSYTLNDSVYTASGTYIQHRKNVAGCDSTITLTLVIKDSTSSVLYDTACHSYTLNDSIYTASGTYIQHRKNAAGCDSTITLNLVIRDSVSTVLYHTSCNGYYFNGSNRTQSGTYTQHFTTTAGCDSTVILHLTIIPEIRIQVYDTACGSYNFFNSVITTSGHYTKYLISAAGCDSIIDLHLIILNNITTVSHDTTICEGECVVLSAGSNLPNAFIQWSNGKVGDTIHVCPTTTTTYKATTGTWGGNLVVNGDFAAGNTGFGTDYSYQYPNNPGFYWIEPGQPFPDHTPTSDNLFLFVDGSYNSSLAFWRQNVTTIQPGTNYRFSFFTSRNDVAPQKIQVLINNIPQTVFNALPIGSGGWTGVFDEFSLVWNSGSNTSAVFEMKDLEREGYGNDFLIDDISLQKQNCTATDSVTVTVKHPTSFVITDTACESYTLNDSIYTASGTYIQHRKNAAGCDSIITLHLTIKNNTTIISHDTTICEGDCVVLTAGSTLSNAFIQWSNGKTGDTIHVCPDTTTIYKATTGKWGGNLVVNGDFGAGNTGFTTDYSYQYPNNPGNYWIEPGQPFPDHTPTADNLFLFVDGSYNSTLAFWRQNVTTIQPSTNYQFSFFTSRNDVAPQKIQVLINNIPQTVFNALPIGSGGWTGVFDEFSLVWNSGSNTSAVFEMKDLEREGYGNDFLIDDISLQKQNCTATDSVTVTVKHPTSFAIIDTACESYMLNDSVYTSSGTYVQHLQNSAGCDSTITLQITIQSNVTTISHDTTICEGDCVVLTASSNLSNAFIQWSNGKVGDTIHVCPTATTTYKATTGSWGANQIINGDFGAGNTGFGTDYAYQYPNNPGNYWIKADVPFPDHTPTADNLFLFVDGAYNSTLAFWRQNVTTIKPFTNYRFSFFTSRNDVAAQKIQVLINSVPQSVFTALPIAPGAWSGVFDEFSLVWNSGSNTSAVFEMKDLEREGYGNDFLIDDISLQKENCTATDSVIVTVGHPTSFTITNTACESYMLNDSVYTSSGTYVQHLKNKEGCDSIITLHLVRKYPTYHTIDTAACGTLIFHGHVYHASVTDTIHATNADGCDSLITLHVVIKHATSKFIDTAVCNSFTLNNYSYVASGAFTQHLTNVAGCDSTITLYLIIKNASTKVIDTMACDTLVIFEQVYTSSGTYTQHLTNAAGCDSLVTLHVIIKHSSSKVIDTTVCNSFTLNKQMYTSSGTYIQHLPNASGCDSTIILHLTILQPVTVVKDTTVCDSLIYNHTTYRNSGTDTMRFRNSNGCDSIIILRIIINQSYRSVINDTICSNALPYMWGGIPRNQNGTYTQAYKTTKGCDSLLIVNLTVIPNPQVVITGDTAVCKDSCTILTATGAPNASYIWWPGGETTQSIQVCPTLKTTYTVTVGTASATNLITNGDFSNGYTGFTAHPILYQVFGDPSPGHYAITNNPLSLAGYLAIPLDHTPTGDNKMLVVDASTDVSKPYFWRQTGIPVQPGTNYRFTFWYALGLAPNAIIRVQVINGSGSPITSKDVKPTGLQSGKWTQYFADFTTPNTYNIIISLSDQNITSFGNDFAIDDIELRKLYCTSTATRTVTIKYPSVKTISKTACDSFRLNSTTYYSSGVYKQQLTNAVGCDSTITLNLTINRSKTTLIYDSTCSFPYRRNGKSYNATGIYRDTFKTSIGCDSIVILHLSAYINTITSSGNVSLCAGTCATLSVSGYPANTSYNWLPTGGNSSSAIVCPSVTTIYRLAATYVGSELIPNGNFNTGSNTDGFVSQYIQSFSTATAAVGTYSIIDQSKKVNNTWTNIADHTPTADNNMLLVDGDIKTPAPFFWQMTVPVTVGNSYRFTYWCAMVNGSNPPAVFGTIANGPNPVVLANFSPILNTANPQGTWQRFSRDFTAANGTITITLRDSVKAPGGNDFAIDDISLQQIFCSDTTRFTVTVYPKPKAVISGLLIIPCDSNITRLTASTATGTPAFTYQWYAGTAPFGSVAGTGYTFAAGIGTWSVVISDANGCKDTAKVVVVRDPCCAYSLQYVQNVCDNGFKFSIVGGIVSAVSWKVDGTTIPGTLNTRTITGYLGDHTVCVTFTVTINGQKILCSKCITVNFLPDTFCSFTADFCFANTPFGTGSQFGFTNTSTAPIGVTQTYLWEFGDAASGAANTSTAANPVHNYATPGAYNVCLTITRTCNGRTCSIRCCKTVYVNAPCKITASTDFQYVVNYNATATAITLTALAAPPLSYYVWKINGVAVSTAASFTYYPQSAGSYLVCLLDSINPDCKKAICHTITIDQTCVAKADFISKWCKSTPLKIDFVTPVPITTGVTYSWSFGDGTSSSLFNPSHTYASAGVYTVCLTVTTSANCSATTCYKVDVGMAICPVIALKSSFVPDEPQEAVMVKVDANKKPMEENEVRKVTFYPNPTTSQTFTVKTSYSLKDANIQVLDMNGKPQQIQVKVQDDKSRGIRLTNAPPGLYFVTIVCMGKRDVGKIEVM